MIYLDNKTPEDATKRVHIARYGFAKKGVTRAFLTQLICELEDFLYFTKAERKLLEIMEIKKKRES